jgi:5-methyltetrahydrofolate--homocysteine methyltransferase
VAYLLPYMEEEKRLSGAKEGAGKVLMATVKGDVHDIGKNIVSVVLGCNGYEIIDLGVMVPKEEILRQAREHQVNIIGLSGLITPSLDEMVEVAREMKRQGFTIPLLIGGATTSRIHTAVKICPEYEPAIHVLDASRAVGVVGALLDPNQKPNYLQGIREEYDRARDNHYRNQEKVVLLPIDEARAQAPAIDWHKAPREQPEFTGVRALNDIPIEDIAPFIDWSPFFHAWELKGVFPQILDHPKYGERARELYADGQRMLRRFIEEHPVRAHAVVGIWPANAVGDDIELYTSEARVEVLGTFHTLRQQAVKKPRSVVAQGKGPRCGCGTNHGPATNGGEAEAPQQNYTALADFVAPRESGLPDFVGAFACQTGDGLDELCAHFEADHDDYNSIMAKVIADRLAEALAEMLHKRVREWWGYGRAENLTNEDLIAERYRGIRPAPGYPACPDHTEKRLIFQLLSAGEKAGMSLTESCAMWPASAVSGLYFAHPQSHYFDVGRIGRDQVEDYARRKGMPMEEVERWLRPNLGYDPATIATAAARA